MEGRGRGGGVGGLQWRVCNRTPALSVFSLSSLSSPPLLCSQSSLLYEHLGGIAAFFLFGVTGRNWKQGVHRRINKIRFAAGLSSSLTSSGRSRVER